jgi:hypothetical protein
MIWLTWRQHRMGLLILALLLAGVAAFILGLSHDAYSAYYQMVHGRSIATCARQPTQDAACNAVEAGFYMRYLDDGPLSTPLSALIILPPLIGMYLGAPLVADELERGTYRLIWTQSVTRLRWLAVKTGTQMGVILLIFALISLLVMWWNGPFNRLGAGTLPFDFEGIVPLAYVAYALSLGIAAGAFLRKTIPAMIVTLLGYLAVRIPIDTWVRPHYLSPLSVTWDPYSTLAPQAPFAAPWGTYNDWNWILYNGWITRAGQSVSMDDFYQACPSGSSGPPFGYSDRGQPGAPFSVCTHGHGWLYMVTWQPHDRFWLFQSIESAIFFALAAALLALAFWWVQTRIS